MNRDKLEQELTRFEDEVLSGLERPPPPQTFRSDINPPPPIPFYPFQPNTNPPPPLSHSFQPVVTPPPRLPTHTVNSQTHNLLPPPFPPTHSMPDSRTFTPALPPPPHPHPHPLSTHNITHPFIQPSNPVNSDSIMQLPSNKIASVPKASNANAASYQHSFPALPAYQQPLLQQVMPQQFMAPQRYCLPTPHIPLIPTQLKQHLPFKPSSVQASHSHPDTGPGGKKEAAGASREGSSSAGNGGGVVFRKKKGLKQLDKKQKKLLRAAAGQVWYDDSMEEWDGEDYRIFCGDLGNEVNDEILYRAFSQFKSLQKVRVIRDKRSHKSKGYGFVSFKDPKDFLSALKEVNGKYIGNRPVKLRKSVWKERTLDVVRKKTVEKKKLGLR